VRFTRHFNCIRGSVSGNFGGGFAVEKEDVGLDSLRVEDAGWQSQQGMNVGLFE
jgi:hypothetical protein